MAKGSNRHPYEGLTVFLGTLHEKDRAIRPVLKTLGMKCEAVAIESDRFGTFSGEIPRQGSVLETLIKKTAAVAERVPGARLVMASEGSFGPHPAFGILPCDHEALLLVDRDQNREFYAEFVSLRVRNLEIEFGSRDDLSGALHAIGTPEHAVVVRPKGAFSSIFMGLRDRDEIARAMVECFAQSPEAKVVISNDLRAHQNPTRMQVIAEAAGKLAGKLGSLCPECRAPGFWPVNRRMGLPCKACGTGTRIPLGHDWKCETCGHQEFRESENARTGVEPKDCDECNP